MPNAAPSQEGASLPSGALAQLARDVGNALIRFAGALDAASPVDDARAGLGPRQRQILSLPGLTGNGMTTKQIADAIE